MRRIKMLLQYDGSNYHGFQRQKNAHTIQAEVEQGIFHLTGEKVSILCAGRTDAGVHALGQVITFDTCSNIPPDKWKFALNSVLPPDLMVLESSEANRDFHPRYHALKKRYCYMIYRQHSGSVFQRNHAYCNNEPLDITRMQQAGTYFIGEHDFRAFCASGSSARTFVRNIGICQVIEEEPFLNLNIEGNGFLYNMVRIIMGTLLDVGRGNLFPEDIPRIIDGRDRSLASATAPAQGLYLVSVQYQKHDILYPAAE